jgi:hypothetical protein
MSRTTQYLRGKTRERGTKTERFMTDGFDRWAESETPASFNSMEKLPTELTKGTMASGMRYGKSLDGMVGSARGRKGKRGGAIFDDFIFYLLLLLRSRFQILRKRLLFYGKDSPAISIFALPIQQS